MSPRSSVAWSASCQAGSPGAFLRVVFRSSPDMGVWGQ